MCITSRLKLALPFAATVTAALLLVACGPGVQEGAARKDAGRDKGVDQSALVDSQTSDGPPPDGPTVDAWACREFHDTKYNHEAAGRAYRCGNLNSNVCARGSNEDLGLWTAEYIWLKETAPGYYVKGRCSG